MKLTFRQLHYGDNSEMTGSRVTGHTPGIASACLWHRGGTGAQELWAGSRGGKSGRRQAALENGEWCVGYFRRRCNKFRNEVGPSHRSLFGFFET